MNAYQYQKLAPEPEGLGRPVWTPPQLCTIGSNKIMAWSFALWQFDKWTSWQTSYYEIILQYGKSYNFDSCTKPAVKYQDVFLLTLRYDFQYHETWEEDQHELLKKVASKEYETAQSHKKYPVW